MKTQILKRHLRGIPLLEVFPEAALSQPLPLIIYYHGWQSQKELVLTQGRKLAQQGFRVLLPDSLNHGARRQKASQVPSLTFFQSIQGNLAEFPLLVAEYQRRGLILNNWLGVGGVSMGGITTSMLLTAHPEIKAGACLMGSPQPWKYLERIQERAQAEKLSLGADYPQLVSWLKYYDLSMAPEKINGRPFYLWHGTKDQRIPYIDVASFYQAIKNEPYAKRTIFVTGEGQDHLVEPDLMTDTADFFTHAYEL
ncbi:alpha/beta fold hydrolase [Enterococcus nangangensis]|uniref:alpha/beta fold hydrolase n=1 Tax=Enterococcus nangangensis TaxID=2559926 RepID=UPI0010F83378|nr:alpha/beta fold hydrolase [Enterococcus nangangensis]